MTAGFVRAIGRWALTAAVINSVVGVGIFGLPAALAGLVGAGSPIAVLAAGAAIVVIVLCFAEVGSRFGLCRRSSDELAALAIYLQISGGSPVGLPAGASMSAERALLLQEAAQEANARFGRP